MGLPAQRVFKGPSTAKTAALNLHNDGCSADNCHRKLLKTPKDHAKVTYSAIGVSRVRKAATLMMPQEELYGLTEHGQPP
jgi:hypothetical protein